MTFSHVDGPVVLSCNGNHTVCDARMLAGSIRIRKKEEMENSVQHNKASAFAGSTLYSL